MENENPMPLHASGVYKTFKPYSGRNTDKRDVMIIFPPLTVSHGEFLEYFYQNAGYRVQALPVEDEAALRTGRMFTNRGQCAPVSYMTGGLINFILNLRKDEWPDEKIVDNYVFVMVTTSGGACRLPAYEEEYRKALHAIGMPEFRVEMMELSTRQGPDSMFVSDAFFAYRFFDAVMLGDIVNDIQRRIRPYERTPGTTDETMVKVRQIIGRSYRDRDNASLMAALARARKLIEAIPVRIDRPRPKVNVIGEFYVASTEGHCTGDLFRWLEAEGAEVMVRPMTTYLMHKLWRKHWMEWQRALAFRHLSIREALGHGWKAVRLEIAYRLFSRRYHRFAEKLGNYSYPLRCVRHMARLTKGLYHKALFSGEGFMVIAEHMIDARKDEADLVLSLKPFTCMPSVCSDGVQVKVETWERNSIFLAIEVNGEGLVNMRSRIQLKLAEAGDKVRSGIQRLCDERGLDEPEIHRIMKAHPIEVPDLRVRRSRHASTWLDLALRVTA